MSSAVDMAAAAAAAATVAAGMEAAAVTEAVDMEAAAAADMAAEAVDTAVAAVDTAGGGSAWARPVVEALAVVSTVAVCAGVIDASVLLFVLFVVLCACFVVCFDIRKLFVG